MSNGTTDIEEKIDLYLQKKLPETERKSFELKLSQDVSLREKLKEQQALHRLLLEAGLKDLKQQMQYDLVERPARMKKIGWVAGLLALAILVLIWVLKKPSTPTSLQPSTTPELSQGTSNEKILPSLPNTESAGLKKIEKEEPSHTEEASHIASEETLNSNLASKENANITEEKNNSSLLANVLERTNATLEKTQEKTNTALANRDCGTFKPVYEKSVQPAHKQQADGKINLKSKMPGLEFSLSQGSQTSATVFENLTAGEYTLIVQNTKGCTAEEQIIVPVTHCPAESPKTFSVSQEQEYVLSLDAELDAKVQVVDRSQHTVLETTPSHQFLWNGRDSQQQMVAPGLYTLYIRYSNGEQCLVRVTVFE
ncbi:MAG: hypothetical protein MUF42_04075 [Cytophagaceae bacterium]|jgi:hypothetical protein|nr:hypothetical protein [Cytophagaceae bacterium]